MSGHNSASDRLQRILTVGLFALAAHAAGLPEAVGAQPQAVPVPDTTPAPVLAGSPSVVVRQPSRERGFLPAHPGLHFFAGDEQVELSEKTIVRMAYAAMEDKLRRSGYQARFQVDEIRTIYSDEFETVLWPDLVTLDGGDELRVDRLEVQNPNGTTGLSYRPYWVVDEEEQTLSLAREVAGMTLGTMLDLASRDQPDFALVVAVTGYRVTASVDGFERVYHGAFFWSAGADGRVSLTVQDQVVDRIDEALVEDRAFAPHDVLMTQALVQPTERDSIIDQIAGDSMIGSCRDFNWPHQFDQSAGRDLQGHVSGHHEGAARFNFSCTCGSDCRSTCQPSISFDQRYTYCRETGNIQGVGSHKVRTSQKFHPASVISTGYTGADCGAGFACAIQWCPWSGCGGFTINGSVQPMDVGVGVNFTYSVQPVWDGQVDFPFECDGCAWGETGDDQPPIEEHQDVPGGGTGGSGGGGTECYWSCGPINGGGGQWYEECTLICFG